MPEPYWQSGDGVPLGRYRTIVADPPWPYDEGWPAFGASAAERRALPYQSMSLEQIAALPVRLLAEPEGYLFLWTTNRYLEDAFRVVRAWTFTPRQVLTWCKEPRGEGPGGMFATTTEFVVIAQRIGPRSHARGKRTLGRRIPSSWFQWKRGAHSQKPEHLQVLIEKVSPGPYVELFARRRRPGWDAWGNEAPAAQGAWRVAAAVQVVQPSLFSGLD
jgi:N6-adenosine-specific RNA methylase IME4